MADDRRRIAAFDVDGTLTTRDCVIPFLRRVGGTRSIAIELLRSARTSTGAVSRRDRDALKALATKASLAGRSVVDVGRAAVDFARVVHAERLRADMLERLRSHQAAGDAIVLVSASYEVYLRPLAGLLGVGDVLACRLETSTDGTYTGALSGPNCRGPEKVVRLHRWLDEHHGGRQRVHVTAYGDSTGDRELLLDADAAVFVGSRRPPWLPSV